MKYKNISILFSILITLVSCKDKQLVPDLVVINAIIWTGNSEQPNAESMVIKGDSIIAIGSNKQLSSYIESSKEVLDMKGAFITPGFIDSHVHLMMGGNALLSVQLRDANTKESFINRISSHADKLKSGDWMLEGNWDHTLWGGELPDKGWIDTHTKENPVVLYRLDGHMVLANSLAIKIAGIDRNTLDVDGGKIVKNEFGEPTGILKGNAMTVLLNKIPDMTIGQRTEALLAAQNYLVSNGITSVHDVDSLGTYEVADKLLKDNKLKVRIYSANPLNRYKEISKVDTKKNKWLKRGLLKGFVDGSLGSHSAAFKEPYTDKPSDKGYFINSEDNIYKWVAASDKLDFQVTVHAIGDSAIHSLLNVYERVIQENGNSDRRFRIEHAQHLAPKDIKRFSELDIIASMQPYHAIDDGRWAEGLIGPERIKTTYAFKSLLDANALLVFGSDWPVAPASPLQGIYAAITRRTTDGKNPEGWVSEQKITIEDALLGYTKNAAFASFDENIKGTLEVGKLADFVVLSENMMKTAPVTIKELKILQTYVGGKKIFDDGDK